MLASIGLDPISGVERYTFGNLYLWDRIPLVSVTLGLFAIPEIIDLSVKGTSIAETHVGKIGGVMEGVKDTFRHIWLVLRCSAIGTYIGVIPGMGGSVSQWVAYAHAVQSSPDKERFGKGAVEGVLGPGAANNSNLGGGLVPTIAFGVPGNVTMAILLGAFIIQGLVPGPPMLLPASRGGHLALTFSFVWIIVVSNIITVACCFMFLKQLARITEVRGSLVIPFLLLLVYLGGFATKNAFEDLIVVLIFGTLGWIMVQLEWPRPPLLLGLVLGPLAENNLFLATDNYGLEWMRFPSVLFIFVVILAGIFFPVFQRWREKRNEPKPKVGQAAPPAPVAVSAWAPIFPLFFVLLFAWALWEARDWGFRPRFFPWAIGFPGLAFALAQLDLDVTGFLRRRVKDLSKERGAESKLEARRTLSIVGWIFGFFVSIWLLGFTHTTWLATFLYVKVGAKENWLISLILAAVAFLSFWGLFVETLHIPFPEGLLVEWLIG
jgi:hypothetical protein